MLKAKDFRYYAREALKGRWIKAGGVGLLAGLLGASIDMSGSAGSFGSSAQNSSNVTEQLGGFSGGSAGSAVSAVFLAVLLGVALVFLVWAIVMLVIGGATTLGFAKYNLNLVDDKDPKLQDIFSQYSRLGTGFGMQFFRGLFIFLWSLLFVIPGIIATYSYSMTAYILCENPEMTAREAIKKSKELMKGNRWRLFCLELSFMGWILLATLGIVMVTVMFMPGLFVMATGSAAFIITMVVWMIVIIAVSIVVGLLLSPYMTVSTAVFYREITEGRYSNPQVEGEAIVEDYRAEETIVE